MRTMEDERIEAQNESYVYAVIESVMGDWTLRGVKDVRADAYYLAHGLREEYRATKTPASVAFEFMVIAQESKPRNPQPNGSQPLTIGA